jgi:hypothetical protein
VQQATRFPVTRRGQLAAALPAPGLLHPTDHDSLQLCAPESLTGLGVLQEDAEAVSNKLKAADAAARERFRARPDLNDADIESLGM